MRLLKTKGHFFRFCWLTINKFCRAYFHDIDRHNRKRKAKEKKKEEFIRFFRIADSILLVEEKNLVLFVYLNKSLISSPCMSYLSVIFFSFVCFACLYYYAIYFIRKENNKQMNIFLSLSCSEISFFVHMTGNY